MAPKWYVGCKALPFYDILSILNKYPLPCLETLDIPYPWRISSIPSVIWLYIRYRWNKMWYPNNDIKHNRISIIRPVYLTPFKFCTLTLITMKWNPGYIAYLSNCQALSPFAFGIQIFNIKEILDKSVPFFCTI